MKLRSLLAGTCTAMAFCATSAQAQSAGCLFVDGLDAGSPQISGSFTTLAFTAGEIVTLSADSITSDASYANAASFTLRDGSSTTVGGPYTYTITGSYATDSGQVSEVLVVPDGGIVGLNWREDIHLGGLYTKFTNLNLSCQAAVREFNLRQASQISVGGQQYALNTAVTRNAGSRLGGGNTNAVTSNYVFLSTTNLADDDETMDLNVWVALDTRAYFDGYEGYSADVTVGMDYLINQNTLIGFMVSAGTSDLEDDAGNVADSDTVMLGGYGAHRFAGTDITLDGYLAIGTANYETSTGDFDTNRALVGVSLSGSYAMPSGILTPRARGWATWEDFPSGAVATVGGRTRQSLLSVGAQMNWAQTIAGTDLRPVASLDIEYRSSDGIDGTSDDFFSPRIGGGVEGMVGSGTLAVSLDVGRTSSDVIDAGLGLVYDLRF